MDMRGGLSVFELEVKCSFDAAHRVAGYPGKCDRLHGHTWTVAAKVRGRKLDGLGMLVDFKAFSETLREVTGVLDHQCLNELPAFVGKNPTAENIARYIYDEMKARPLFRDASARLSEVRIWESPHSCVSYFEDEPA